MTHQLPPHAPAPRGISDWQAAETNALAWLRWLGHSGAASTSGGADGGLDVLGDGSFAQVKFYGKAISVQPLRELYGARAGRRGRLYFFINSGYSQPALDYAEQVGVAAFTYAVDTGRLTPVSSTAHTVYEEAARRAAPTSPATPPAMPPAPSARLLPPSAPAQSRRSIPLAPRPIAPATPTPAPRRTIPLPKSGTPPHSPEQAQFRAQEAIPGKLPAQQTRKSIRLRP
ncbi:restriction endonuclease [Streptomyces sp. 5.8]|uniref:restriction endonuclease n=1 Tax=Streptomyces sp. 5.8 TaxID=3406571 RepID=UPI003BB67DEA